MFSETYQEAWHRTLGTVNWIGSTGAGLVLNSLIPVAAEPGTTPGTHGVFYNPNKNSLKIVPIGAVDNTTFTVRIEDVRQVYDSATPTWIFVPIAKFACTTGTTHGVAGGFPVVGDRFADTITKTFGGNGVEVVSNAANEPAHAIVDLAGATKFRISLANVDGTSCNVLFATL